MKNHATNRRLTRIADELGSVAFTAEQEAEREIDWLFAEEVRSDAAALDAHYEQLSYFAVAHPVEPPPRWQDAPALVAAHDRAVAAYAAGKRRSFSSRPVTTD
jgi:hypothetical protein